MPTGRVKWFNDVKGFGFIECDEHPDQDIFVHFSTIQQDGFRSLKEGQEVTFELQEGPNGLFASDVKMVD